MFHPHYIFWLFAPAALTLCWFPLRKLPRGYYLLVLLVTALVVVLPGTDFGQLLSSTEVAAGLLVAGSPFVGVAILTMAGWSTLQRWPWLAAVAVPVTYYLGFTAGVTIGMAAGLVHS